MSESDLLWNKQPLSYWLNALESADNEMRWMAVDALRHIEHPTRSLPIFLRVLKQDSFHLARGLAAHAIYDMTYDEEFISLVRGVLFPLKAALFDPSINVSVEIINTLEMLGEAAFPALSQLELLAKSENKEVRKAATGAILTITMGGPPRHFIYEEG
jgi:hypothetical protein